ncbi:MAG: glycosyltransferase 87 family protein [Acidobacteriota bacterium]
MTGRSNRKSFDLLLLVLSFLGSGVVSVFLGQDGNWDLRNYHFYNAYSFLNGRLTYDIAPAQVQSFHNPLMDVPFYWMMTHLKPVLYGFLVGGMQGFNFWLVYKITYTILNDLSETRRQLLSLASGLAGYYGAANLSEIGTTFYDNVTSLFVLSALLLIISWISSGQLRSENVSRKNAVIAGFLLGCGTGLKLPAAIYSLAFAVSLLSLKSQWKAKFSNVLLSSLGICLGILTTMGYWMTVLWKNFRSPLFPYYNKIFRSPYYKFSNIHDDRFFPRDKYQVLFYPFHTFFVVFFVLSYVIWQHMFSIYRYIVPLELLSPVFIILVMRYIFPSGRILFRVSLGIFVVMILTMSPMNWGRVPWTESYFGVKLPALTNIADATVIMADNEPLSYIIPSFPERTRFVSVKNNFMRPDLHNMLQEKIRDTLRTCGKRIYLLYRSRSREDYVSILAYYNLKMDRKSAAKIFTKFDNDLYLVPVSRIQTTMSVAHVAGLRR